MLRTKSATTAYRILLLAMALVMAASVFCVPPEVFAAGNAVSKEVPDLDYIKGRPLTQQEQEEQLEIAPDPEEPLPETDLVESDVEVVEPEEESTLVQAARGSYDPRDKDWYKRVKIDDQGGTGLCWAYAMSTAMEICYFKQKGSKGKNLSGAHLGYFFFHRANDPLKKTKSDKNKLIGTSAKWYSIGGSSELTIQALAGWIGAASESRVSESKKTASFISASRCYTDDVIIKNAKYLDDTDEIKQAILNKGCVEAQVYMNATTTKYYNPDTAAYYYDGGSTTNHEVVIIGWNDDYSKENFQSAHRPDKNGAWIVQNSYGTKWADNGCYYMSYEDTGFLSGNVLAIEVQPASTYKYNYQYDGNSSPMSYTLYEGEKVGNIFKVPGASVGRSQLLKAVGITTWKKGSKFRIDIYRNLTSRSRPTKGEKVCTKYVTTNYPGYYTIKLPKTVRLKTGSYYSIVVTSRNGAKFGIEKNYKILAGDSGINFVSGNLSKRSFAYLEGSWADMYSAKQSARIKGFTTLSACIKNIAVKSKGRKYVKLRWDKMDGYRGYAVYRKVNGSYKLVIKYRGTAYNAYKVKNLKPGKTYRFRVRAYKIINGVTYYSGASKTITVKTKN